MSRLIGPICIFILVLAGSNAAEAQPFPVGWESFSSQEHINALLDDGESLWVGTNGGLLHVQKAGGDVVRYDRENSCLPGNIVLDLLRDSSGTVVVFTDFGTVYFDGTGCSSAAAEPGSRIAVAEAGEAGEIWWRRTYITGLLRRFVGTDYSDIKPSPDDFFMVDIRDMSYGGEGILWMTDGSKILRYDAHADSSDWLDPGPTHDVQVLSAAGADRLWTGSDFGLGIFDGSTWHYYPDSVMNGSVLDIQVHNETVWLSTDSGFAMFDGEDWHHFTSAVYPDLAYAGRTFIVDDEGILWSGNNRLVRFDGVSAVARVVADTNMPPQPQSMAVGIRGDVWFGVAGYVYHYADSSMQRYPLPSRPGRADTSLIFALAVDSRGDLWVAAENRILKFDGDRWYEEEDLGIERNTHDLITSLAVDREDNLWIGAIPSVGLTLFNGDTTMEYTRDNSPLPDNFVKVVITQPDGQVWVGTNQGLMSIDPSDYTDFTGWQVYQEFGWQTSIITVQSLCDAGDGSVWVGMDYGLVRMNGGTVVDRLDAENAPIVYQGLAENAIARDSTGNLWIATRYSPNEYIALYRYDGSQWDSVINPNTGVTAGFIATASDGSLWTELASGVARIDARYPLSFDIVPVEQPSPAILLSPNPATDRLDVSLELPKVGADVVLSIADLRGATVLALPRVAHRPAHSSRSIDLRSIPPGRYFLRVEIDGVMFARPFTVVR